MHQVARAVKTPLVGIGGIATIDDVLEFIVAGATAVQIGTANYYDPTVSMKLLDQLLLPFDPLRSELHRVHTEAVQPGAGVVERLQTCGAVCGQKHGKVRNRRSVGVECLVRTRPRLGSTIRR